MHPIFFLYSLLSVPNGTSPQSQSQTLRGERHKTRLYVRCKPESQSQREGGGEKPYYFYFSTAVIKAVVSVFCRFPSSSQRERKRKSPFSHGGEKPFSLSLLSSHAPFFLPPTFADSHPRSLARFLLLTKERKKKQAKNGTQFSLVC